MRNEKVIVGFFAISIFLFPFSNIFGEKCLKAEDDQYGDGYNYKTIKAIRTNNIDLLRQEISNGLDINVGICAWGDEYYQYFLINAASEVGNLEIVKLLIYTGADIHKKSPSIEANCTMGCERYNALYFASSHPEIITYLKSLGIKDEVVENNKQVRELQEKIERLEPDKESLKLLLGEWTEVKTCENQKCENSLSQPVLTFQKNRIGHYSYSFDGASENYDFDYNLKGKKILARVSKRETSTNLIISNILKLNKKTLILQDENSKYQQIYQRTKKIIL